jgi:hypothetical protein
MRENSVVRDMHRIMATAATFLIVAAMFTSLSCVRRKQALPASPQTQTKSPTAPTAANVACQVVKGKWVRPDGGYIIDIMSISQDGTMGCTYFNPDPIHVSQATAADDNGVVRVFVELRDEGYPGCTYKLTYDVQSDQLKGVYYQAAVHESYNIYFVRLQ